MPLTAGVVDLSASGYALRDAIAWVAGGWCVYDEADAKSRKLRAFGVRSIVLALFLVALTLFRIHLNGYTPPDFIPDQNPAAFDRSFVTRFFSIPWVHFLLHQDVCMAS